MQRLTEGAILGLASLREQVGDASQTICSVTSQSTPAWDTVDISRAYYIGGGTMRGCQALCRRFFFPLQFPTVNGTSGTP